MIEIIDFRSSKSNVLYEKLKKRSHMEVGNVLETVEEIIDEVKLKGDEALVSFTNKFDKTNLEKTNLKVSRSEIEEAFSLVDKDLIEVIKRAKENIKSFHEKQKDSTWFDHEKEGVVLGQLIRPIQNVGVYVPGGTAPLPSSVLMNVIPARVAGVEKIIMCTPPMKNGKINPVILVAAAIAGVDEIFRVGGAQAIAGLACGTQSIKKVDKIVGPGNIYVAMAKKLVYGYCDIDMIAGPSEIMVIADETANAKFVAADLLSQAEHDVLASSILVTTSEYIATEVRLEVERQTGYLERKNIIDASISNYSAIVIVNDLDEAFEVSNKIAPEHLELCIEDPFNSLWKIRNAGAVFLGNYSSEPLGDYFAGPNHVLPTSGTARFFSPLNVGDFIKKTSVIYYSNDALKKVKDDVIMFAESEGLTGHANAIKVRFEDEQKVGE